MDEANIFKYSISMQNKTKPFPVIYPRIIPPFFIFSSCPIFVVVVVVVVVLTQGLRHVFSL
jgi:hypothetical protein